METNVNNLVSVIIPCYNDYKYIQAAIDSINNQTYSLFEIIIIDDGSAKETKKVLKSLQQENLTILFQENMGPSAARNNGIKHAAGDLILTLDADDYFDSSFVEKAALILNQHEDIGLVTCNGYVFNDEGIITEIISKEGNAVDFLFENTAIGNSLFRKKCWSEIGGFDENMRKGYEDWDFHISLLKTGWKIKVINEHLFYYRNKPNSRNKNANKVRYELINYLLIKHRDLSIQKFETLLSNFLVEFNRLSSRNDIIKKSIDYRVGNKILKPLRFMKKIFRSNHS